MSKSITDILHQLQLDRSGRYENNFYIIDLKNSDEYSRMYSLLTQKANNTENPHFEMNSANNLTAITNYFEVAGNEGVYNIFLTAKFVDDKYFIRISTQPIKE